MRVRVLLTAGVAAVALTAGAAAAGATPPTASCLGYGSSVLGPAHQRDDIARNPDAYPPGADTSTHAHAHGNTFDTCFNE